MKIIPSGGDDAGDLLVALYAALDAAAPDQESWRSGHDTFMKEFGLDENDPGFIARCKSTLQRTLEGYREPADKGGTA